MIFKLVNTSVLLLVLLPGCSKTIPEDGTKEFQGSWQSIASSSDGKQVSAVFESDVVQLHEEKKPSGANAIVELTSPEKFAFRLNRSETPAQIDFVFLDGANQGKTRFGIYALEDNKLKICMSDVDGARPTEFNAKDKISLMVLERKK